MQLLKQLFTSYSQVISSFFYIGIVLVVYLRIQRNAQLEEAWLGILRNSINTQLYYVLLYGLIGGLLTSFIILIFEIRIEFEAMLIIWPISLFLMLFNPRYLCPSYSIGIVSLMSLIFGWPAMEVSPMIMLVGILHLAEGLLILIDGARDSIPVYIEHDRFTPAGAHIMNRMWPIPLATITAPGQLVFPAVAVLVYEDWAITQTTHRRVRESGFWAGIYGLTLLILAMASIRIKGLTYLAVLATLAMHEIITRWNRQDRLKGEPIFKAPWRGIRVLDVLPESPGKAMGLMQSDIILYMNGRQVNSETMLEEILRDSPNFIWVTILRGDGETLELEYRDYERGIKDLGLIFVPRTTAKYYIFKHPKGILVRLWDNYFKG
ncbi:MAG TPA: PDZ domain-containing protein [Clostridia bacterium]|nr:PDZ domain-containing protein [Clostridia bacterium]